jgi:uncharacterized membrane protein
MSLHSEPLLLLPNDEAQILAALQAADERTTVETHVRVEASSRDSEARAGALLRASTARAGRRQRLLLYVLAHDRRCVVVIDPALRALASTRVWRDVENRLTLDILAGKLSDGIVNAIQRFSYIAAGHFPLTAIPSGSAPPR